MTEGKKPEYRIVMHENENEAAKVLNEAAAEGYELTMQSSAYHAGNELIYTVWTLHLRPEVRLAQEENQYWQNRVTALSAIVTSHADYHAGWDNGILSRLESLDAASDGRARTLANVQDRIESLEAAVQRLIGSQSRPGACPVCAGTGRLVAGTSHQGPITAGCSTCDGTGRS